MCLLRRLPLSTTGTHYHVPTGHQDQHCDPGDTSWDPFHCMPDSSPPRAWMTSPRYWSAGKEGITPRARALLLGLHGRQPWTRGHRARFGGQGCVPALLLALVLISRTTAGNLVSIYVTARYGGRARRGSLTCSHQADQCGGGDGGRGQGSGLFSGYRKDGNSNPASVSHRTSVCPPLSGGAGRTTHEKVPWASPLVKVPHCSHPARMSPPQRGLPPAAVTA